MVYPAEAVPDGNQFAPHHLYTGALLALFVCWAAARRASEAPLSVVGGLLVALMGFALTWHVYPALGATMTLSGVTASLVGLTVRRAYWTEFGFVVQGLVLVGLLVAMDDAVSHSFGVWTPLDWAFKQYAPFKMIR